MISANLVGFAVGLDGLEVIIKNVLHDWSGKWLPMHSVGCLPRISGMLTLSRRCRLPGYGMFMLIRRYPGDVRDPPGRAQERIHDEMLE